jgi:anti-sigma factor RsiW
MRAMNCATVQELLNRYHDAELEPAARAEVEHHLSACPACREALAQLEGVAGLWAARKTPPVPEGFAERVMRQARRRTVPQPTSRWSDWPLLRWWWEQSAAMRAAAAAVVVAGLVAGSVLGLSNSSAKTSAQTKPASAVTENIALLTGAPHGSLEQDYLALAFPSEASKPSP